MLSIKNKDYLSKRTLSSLWRIFLDHFERLFDRPCNHGPVADLDDRPLEQPGIGNDQCEHIRVIGFGGKTALLERGLALSHGLDRPQIGLFEQFAKVLLGERFDEIIYLVVVDAVFTKQRSQITAGRSGRFFVDSDLIRHN
jgi:hypothetical protein